VFFKFLIIYHYLRFRWQHFPNRAVLEHRQKRGLRLFEAFLRKKSPWYASQLAQYGSIEQLPIIQKATYMAHFSEINTVGISWDAATTTALEAENSRDFSPTIGRITVGLSSGTTGNRGIFLVSPKERAQWVAMVLHRVIGFSWKRRKVAFFLRSGSKLYESVQSSLLDFRFYDLSRPFQELLQVLKTQQPDIIVAQPAALEQIADAVSAGTLQLSLRQVVSVAEVLEQDVRHRLEGVFGLRLTEVYQCTEGLLASSCPEGRLHFHEEVLRVEKRWLDDTHTRYYPIITDFTRHTQPIVRYELNDIIHTHPAPCPCGRVTEAIGHIEGRQDDALLFFRENTRAPLLVFPDFMRRVVISGKNADQIAQYQVVQEEAGYIKMYVQITDIGNVLFEVVTGEIRANLEDFCRKNQLLCPNVHFENTIPYRPMEKFRRVKRLCLIPETTSFL
jgi:putative adenylate-forming enzyme